MEVNIECGRNTLQFNQKRFYSYIYTFKNGNKTLDCVVYIFSFNFYILNQFMLVLYLQKVCISNVADLSRNQMFYI